MAMTRRAGRRSAPATWPSFEGHAADVERLRALARSGPLTLVFAARDAEHSSAAVLREVLLGRD